MRIYLFFIFSFSLFSQELGTLSGTIKDAKTGMESPGVNVMVKGTYYGAATDLNGNFNIRNISPGSYDIEVSMIGYKVILNTGVKIVAGKTTKIDFELEETVLSFGEDVIVMGKKPLFDVDETSSMARVRREDIENKVVSSVEDILAEQIGVTTQDNEIHIRGGRIDESMFMVDGFSVKDPLSGYSGNLFVNADAIEELEIITGGYSAEYGQAMSGIINIKLKEGRDHYEGAVKIASDRFLKDNFKSDRIEFNLGGPELFFQTLPGLIGKDLPGRFSFFINGYGKMYDGNLPIASKLYPHRYWSSDLISEEDSDSFMEKLAPRENNDWHLLYKMTWELTPQKKFSASYDASMNINQGYYMPRAFASTYFPYRYMEILDYYNTITRDTRLINMNWTHTLSPKSFYEFTFGKFTTMEHSSVQDLPWTDYKERLDLEPINYNLDNVNHDGNVHITYGDKFYDTGFAPEWYDLSSENTRMDLDWTYHTETRHKLKTGFEHTITEIQVLDIDEPWSGSSGFGANYDSYNAKTYFGAFYFQDRIIFEGMTLNIGFRNDYWIPGRYVENAISDTSNIIITDEARVKFEEETFDFPWAGDPFKMKARLSPRFGISHPVTDNDVLYFYYGHFSQLPTFQYVYAKINSKSQSTYQVFGNPNLNPKTTVQYELGVKHRFNEDQVLELKAYWKDMFDYETSQTIKPSNPKYAHLSFSMYFNSDYARARGIEAILKSRLWQNWFVDMNFNYSIITGKSSSPLDNLLVQAGQLSEKPLGENFMSWDRPFHFFTNLSYNHPKNWGASARIEFESGRRYTRSIIDTIINVNEKEYYEGPREDDRPYAYVSTDAKKNMDVKLFKTFMVSRFKIKSYLEIENVLNQQIPRRVNPYTGKGYEPGEIYGYNLANSPNPNTDPSRYNKPRTMEMGIQIIF
ncbi:MAG: TonB-dependent receptor [Candidatus Marinimicrobia bacterium]|jgi:outer membrane receptor protein involved in Fe transport|nr:TonB-dependent receptor [Candidatus Neomarinimicrobiota bacterium]MBT7514659.1 TonB-dependent receptor [Candidatus Neomarinimicrobiota bacterium]